MKSGGSRAKIAQLYEYYMASVVPRVFTKRFRDRYICILCTEIHWITINAHFYIQT